jgi:hypothetical protein
MKKATQLKTTATVALAALAAALVSVLLAAHTPALAQKSPAADTRHPRVIDVRPAEGATDVSIVAKPYVYHRVVAYFSEDMRKLTVEKSFEAFKKGSNTPIAPSYGVRYDARKQAAILRSDYAPKRGVTYKAVVSTQAEDLAGNRLDQNRTRAGLQPKVWYFTMEEVQAEASQQNNPKHTEATNTEHLNPCERIDKKLDENRPLSREERRVHASGFCNQGHDVGPFTSSASASPTPVPLGGTGGPAILLPAAALLLGSGILTYAILRRR